MPLDPMSLTCAGVANWMTDVIVAWKFSEAVWRQSALMMNAVGSPLRPPY
jgi:hypothetical protein